MRARALLFLSPLLVLAACGDESNRLYGSMSQVYKLDFDQVQIKRVGDEVAVEYQRLSNGAVAALVAKLTVQVGDLANMANNEIPLTEKVNGLSRGSIQRVESTTTSFPLQLGTVLFKQEPVGGADLSGWFHTTLADPAGRTLNGDFQGKVQAF